MGFKRLADIMAIRVSQTHKIGTNFHYKQLFDPGQSLANNNVSPAISNDGSNSGLVSEVDQVRKLAMAIMQSTLKIRPWPVCFLSLLLIRFSLLNRHLTFLN